MLLRNFIFSAIFYLSVLGLNAEPLENCEQLVGGLGSVSAIKGWELNPGVLDIAVTTFSKGRRPSMNHADFHLLTEAGKYQFQTPVAHDQTSKIIRSDKNILVQGYHSLNLFSLEGEFLNSVHIESTGPKSEDEIVDAKISDDHIDVLSLGENIHGDHRLFWHYWSHQTNDPAFLLRRLEIPGKLKYVMGAGFFSRPHNPGSTYVFAAVATSLTANDLQFLIWNGAGPGHLLSSHGFQHQYGLQLAKPQIAAAQLWVPPASKMAGGIYDILEKKWVQHFYDVAMGAMSSSGGAIATRSEKDPQLIKVFSRSPYPETEKFLDIGDIKIPAKWFLYKLAVEETSSDVLVFGAMSPSKEKPGSDGLDSKVVVWRFKKR
jgi:hypothetical protein